MPKPLIPIEEVTYDIMRQREVAERFNFTVRKLAYRIKQGQFPEPHFYEGRERIWLTSWIKSRIITGKWPRACKFTGRRRRSTDDDEQ